MTSSYQLLRAAGPGAHLVARPGGVAHAYVGPLTPSGRFIPRTRRTVCRAHTRRLTVLEQPSLQLGHWARRVCARCSARLLRGEGNARAEQPTTRDEWIAAYQGLSLFDLAVDAYMAQTPDEVTRVEFLGLLLHGLQSIRTTPVVSPTGKTTPPLDQQIRKARIRVGGVPDDPTGRRLDLLVAERAEQQKAERHQIWREREDRIRQLGFVNATSSVPA